MIDFKNCFTVLSTNFYVSLNFILCILEFFHQKSSLIQLAQKFIIIVITAMLKDKAIIFIFIIMAVKLIAQYFGDQKYSFTIVKSLINTTIAYFLFQKSKV